MILNNFDSKKLVTNLINKILKLIKYRLHINHSFHYGQFNSLININCKKNQKIIKKKLINTNKLN